MLLGWRAMRSSNAATNPWGTSVDDGWRDLVVSSAPPPSASPPPPPRDAYDTGPKNRALPMDITTWQEHGAPRVADGAVEEPSFTASDRRLWLIAGTLMGLAVLVLGVLGMLTFGGASPTATAPAPVAVDHAAPDHATRVAAAAPAHASEAARVASASLSTKTPPANGPRTLKRTKHARHHKRIAAR